MKLQVKLAGVIKNAMNLFSYDSSYNFCYERDVYSHFNNASVNDLIILKAIYILDIKNIL